MFAAVPAMALASCSGGSGGATTGEGADAGPETVEETLPPTTLPPQTFTVATAVPVGDFPVEVAVGGGAVWVANAGDGTVSRIDSTTREVVATIEVGANPQDLAAHGDDLWVVNEDDSTVSRVSIPTDEVLATIDVDEGADSIVAGDRGVWVASFTSGTLSRIDEEANEVASTIDLGDEADLADGSQPVDLVVANDDLWLSLRGNPSLARVDPETAEVTAVPLDGDGSGYPEDLVAGPDAVWVLTDFGAAIRVDADTEEVRRLPTDYAGVDLAVADGRLLVAGHDANAVGVRDPNADGWTTFDVDAPIDIAVDDTTAWVVNRDLATVTVVDIS